MTLVIDETFYNAFLKDGVQDETARAFAHFFAYCQGRCDLENFLKEKFEKIGLLDPDGVTIHIENIEDSLEWLLLVQCFEGKLERKFDQKDKCFKYKNTELGNAEAESLIRNLAKK